MSREQDKTTEELLGDVITWQKYNLTRLIEVLGIITDFQTCKENESNIIMALLASLSFTIASTQLYILFVLEDIEIQTVVFFLVLLGVVTLVIWVLYQRQRGKRRQYEKKIKEIVSEILEVTE